MSPPDPLHVALDLLPSSADDAFVIASVDDQANRYAQFLPTPGGGLAAELVGNQYLAPEHQLSAPQQERVRALGWSGDGDENWTRELPSPASAEDRHRFADEAVGALREIYRARGPLRVEANLDAALQREAASRGVHAPSTPPKGSPWILWVAGLVLLLVALVLLGVL